MKKPYAHLTILLLVTIPSHILVSIPSQAQVANASLVLYSETDRVSVVKSTVPLTDWHEKSFWSQYSDYREKILNISLRAYQSITNLGKTTGRTEADDALENATEMIDARLRELEVRQQYYSEISREHNGIVAMKFLQTEFKLDLYESWRLYEQTPLRNYRFRSAGLSSAEYNQLKYNLLSKALSLSSEEATIFFPIYSLYQKECDDTLGKEYEIYEVFTGEASDLTPGLAKRQGNNLITLMEREVLLKQKYFNELNNTLGASIAARFLAWEDYYSIGCKLSAWGK